MEFNLVYSRDQSIFRIILFFFTVFVKIFVIFSLFVCSKVILRLRSAPFKSCYVLFWNFRFNYLYKNGVETLKLVSNQQY